MHDDHLIVDFYRRASRQGPGGEAETQQALELAGLDRSRPLKVADIGCGTGASTIILARELNAQITAVDRRPEFLDELTVRARDHAVANRITPLNCSMDALPFAAEEFDVIWSEGAVFIIGFETGVSAWNRFLKPGGHIVLSEITWLTATRPPELQRYWEQVYAEIDVASAKIAVLERHGYRPAAYFVVPSYCWLENYYTSVLGRSDEFLARHGHSDQAKAIVDGVAQ